MEELDASFSGVVLTFEPGPDFKKGGERPSLSAALRQAPRRAPRPRSSSSSSAAWRSSCPGLVVPTFSRIFIDEYLVSNHTALLRPLLLGMAIDRRSSAWSSPGCSSTTCCASRRSSRSRTSSEFFRHILRLPVAYFSQRFAGEIGSRVLINDKVANIISGKLATTALDCLLIVFYAVLMLLYDVWLTLLVIAIALLNIVAVRVVARRRIDGSRRLAARPGQADGHGDERPAA